MFASRIGSLLLPTAVVSSPAAGGAGKEALDIKKFAEVAERFQQANLEQEIQTLADIERALRLRNALVRAFLEKRIDACDRCVEFLEKLIANKRILMETDIGFVLLDSSVWSDKFRPRITALKLDGKLWWRDSAQQWMEPEPSSC